MVIVQYSALQRQRAVPTKEIEIKKNVFRLNRKGGWNALILRLLQLIILPPKHCHQTHTIPKNADALCLWINVTECSQKLGITQENVFAQPPYPF